MSISLGAYSCIEAVEEALAKHGTPEIVKTDQGSPSTLTDFIKALAARKIRMDGKGAWRDERLRQAIVTDQQV